MERIPAEVFHPSEFILDEMKARGWSRDDLALRMGDDFGIQRLALDFYLDVGPDARNMRITPEYFARAFGTSEELWKNLENAWLKGDASTQTEQGKQG